MNARWLDFFDANGFAAPGGAAGSACICDFGDPGRELLAARDGSVVAPISHLGVLEVSGADASNFLHGQFSSDVGALLPWRAEPSAYCSPKGRVLMNCILWREGETYAALLPGDLAAAIRKRLAMFVLRAKVVIEDASAQNLLLGVAGPAAAGALSHALGVDAGPPMSVVRAAAGPVISLGGERFIVLLKPDGAAAAWTALANELTPVGEEAWHWLEIRSGTPWITAKSQDQFVPQMVNLDLVGAINFHKGCYPGQEIVARTKYLGKTKRRLFRCHSGAGVAPDAMTELYSADFGDQPCGLVVNAAAAPGGGCDMLAVIQVESAQPARGSGLRLAAPDGPEIAVLELPYRIPQAA